ncbi:MAG: TfoX/Sxy family protein [Candidatus Rifleibacteriota bacterium]
MASSQDFVDYVVDQISWSVPVTSKKMFGEFAIYCGGKIVAMICDDQVFVKPTGKGREFIGEVVEGPPYPGAKPCFIVTDQVDDREWLSRLIQLTSAELPQPKPKVKKAVRKTAKE